MDLNALLEKVAYLPHHERMRTYGALTERERIPLRVEVDAALAREADADNEFATDRRKLRIAVQPTGR